MFPVVLAGMYERGVLLECRRVVGSLEAQPISGCQFSEYLQVVYALVVFGLKLLLHLQTHVINDERRGLLAVLDASKQALEDWRAEVLAEAHIEEADQLR